ncbi:MAG TPA: zinc ribbon domain-containing protein [Pyrinomonadaceae bacterium]|nr:zinc ribbon domain-containing protein [Pyrinomonadaceae bacterium]
MQNDEFRKTAFYSSFIILHSSFVFMEPEIARRCMTCGAAVRGRARFCPQCGQDMSEASTLNRPALVEEQTGTPSGRLVDEAERVARALNDSMPPLAADAGSAQAISEQKQLNEPVAPEQAPAQTTQPTQTSASAVTTPLADVALPHDIGDDARARAAHLEASSSRLSGVRARAGERVERLREVSVVVFDEAHDDPALRFVLVAAALFVGFLLILLFSHILR